MKNPGRWLWKAMLVASCSLVTYSQSAGQSPCANLIVTGTAALDRYDYREADRLFSAAIEQCEAAGLRDRDLAAVMYHAAAARQQMGAHHGAIRLIRHALEILNRETELHPLARGIGWEGLGTSYLATYAYANARKAYQKALDLIRAAPVRANDYEISVLCGLSTAYKFEKRYADAAAAIEEAVNLLHPDTDGSVQALVLSQAGALALLRERFDEAELRLRRAAAILDDLARAGGSSTILVPIRTLAPQLWTNLATVCLKRKQYPEAEALLSKSWRAVDEGARLPPADVAKLHTTYALCLRKLGRRQDAKAHEAMAKAVMSSVPPPVGALVVDVEALKSRK